MSKFFYFSFAGDTGDMKSLKIYTNIQVKPKSAGLLTRQFDSKGAPLFLDFLLVTLMTSEKWMSAQFFCLSFAGDPGDTGDMKNLKIYTIIQVKPKYAVL